MVVAICRLYQSSLQKELCIKIEKMFKFNILKYWTFSLLDNGFGLKKIMSKIIKYRLNGSLTTQPPGLICVSLLIL